MTDHWTSRRDRLREIAAEADLELKGKTVPYFSANGHMFAQLNKDAQFGIRLSEEDRAGFAEEHDASEFRSYGSVMRDYVLMPDELWDDSAEIVRWLLRGREHVRSLEPK